MTRVRIFTVFLMAILAGGGLAYGTYDYLQNVPVKTVTRADAARSSWPMRTCRSARQLRRDDLATLDWPAAAVPEGAFEDPAAIVDRGLIVSVVKNEPILSAKLASKEAGAGLAADHPARQAGAVGARQRSHRRRRLRAARHARRRRGDREPDQPIGRHHHESRAPNVEVLAAGTRLEQDTPDGKPMQVTVVTLLVTPDESERLTLASTEGKIQLALRNPLDTEIAGHVGHQARHAARQRAAETGRASEGRPLPGSLRRFHRRRPRSK